MTQVAEVAPVLDRISTNAVFRPGRIEDAEACGAICYEGFETMAGAHNFPPEFPSPETATGLMSSVLARSYICAVVVEMHGRIVGSNFFWEDGDNAGVGPITVDPNVQNGALGRRHMENVLDRARQRRFAGARLVQATYHNRWLSSDTKLLIEQTHPADAQNARTADS